MKTPTKAKSSHWKGWVVPSDKDEADLKRKHQAFSFASVAPIEQTEQTRQPSPSPSQQFFLTPAKPTTNGNPFNKKGSTSSLSSVESTPHHSKKASITIKPEPKWRRNPVRQTSQVFESERDIANDVHDAMMKGLKATPAEQVKLEARITKRLFHLTQDPPAVDPAQSGVHEIPIASFSNGEGTLTAVFIPKDAEEAYKAKYPDRDEAKIAMPVFAKRFSTLEVDLGSSSTTESISTQTTASSKEGDEVAESPRKRRKTRASP